MHATLARTLPTPHLTLKPAAREGGFVVQGATMTTACTGNAKQFTPEIAALLKIAFLAKVDSEIHRIAAAAIRHNPEKEL